MLKNTKGMGGIVKVYTVEKVHLMDGWPVAGAVDTQNAVFEAAPQPECRANIAGENCNLMAEAPAEDVKISFDMPSSFRIYYRRGDAVYMRDDEGYKIKITRDGLGNVLKPGAEFIVSAEMYQRQMVDIRKVMFL